MTAAQSIGNQLAESLSVAVPPAILAELETLLRDERHMEALDAEIEYQRLRRLNTAEHRAIDGVGEVVARIPVSAYHYWGARLGYQCWDDPQFMHEFMRDNPDVRVKSAGTRIQVGFNGDGPRRVPVKHYPAAA